MLAAAYIVPSAEPNVQAAVGATHCMIPFAALPNQFGLTPVSQPNVVPPAPLMVLLLIAVVLLLIAVLLLLIAVLLMVVLVSCLLRLLLCCVLY